MSSMDPIQEQDENSVQLPPLFSPHRLRSSTDSVSFSRQISRSGTFSGKFSGSFNKQKPKPKQKTVVYPEIAPSSSFQENFEPDIQDEVFPNGVCNHCGTILTNKEGYLEVTQEDLDQAKLVQDCAENDAQAPPVNIPPQKFRLHFEYRVKLALFTLLLFIVILAVVFVAPYYLEKIECNPQLGEMKCPPGNSASRYTFEGEAFCCGANSTCCLDETGDGTCCGPKSTCCGGQCCSANENCCGTRCIPRSYRCCSSDTGTYCGESLKCCVGSNVIGCCPESSSCSEVPPFCSSLSIST